jgi:tetratricopeptide (TPR) repeat protein
LDEALASDRGNGEISPDLRSAALTHRGEVFLADGRFDEADAIFRESLLVNRNAFDAWTGLALSRFLRGDFSGAAGLARREYEIAKDYGVDDTAEAAMEWARYRSAAGEAAQALPLMRAALPVLRKNYRDGARLAYYFEAAAFVLNRAGFHEEAAHAAREALAVLSSDGAPDRHPLAAASWEELGDALRGLRRMPESASALEKAAEIYSRLGSAYAAAATRVRTVLSASVH